MFDLTRTLTHHWHPDRYGGRLVLAGNGYEVVYVDAEAGGARMDPLEYGARIMLAGERNTWRSLLLAPLIAVPVLALIAWGLAR